MPASIETEWDRAIRYYKNEASVIEQPLRNRIIHRQEYKQLISLYWDLDPLRLIWEILYNTGMRPIEACWLQLDNLDLEKGEIAYKVSKPGRKETSKGIIKVYKSRVVPIPEDLKNKLKKYLILNKDGFRYGFLFPAPSLQSKHPHINPRSLNFEMSRVRPKLGGRWLERNSYGDHLIGPHSFRRSWIVRYLDKYQNPAECSRAIGHNDINTTFGYYQEIKKNRLREFINSENIIIKVPKITSDQTTLIYICGSNI